ncbi:hypothetical protein POTOM_056512 [Populus tomentosa]|uniref:Uncharacterized protein n=1 Tax=Populus tomentosa TaxID=118781 RepID=A0A8X7XVD7_POPTO|nr:hypothetical protein POTOM_056512 [Populus tomentosa]
MISSSPISLPQQSHSFGFNTPIILQTLRHNPTIGSLSFSLLYFCSVFIYVYLYISSHEGEVISEKDVSAETTAPPSIVPSQSMGIGLASLLPKKYEPSTMYGWRAGLSSFLFKQGN